MWQRLFQFGAVVSLILFLAAVALWVRSYFATDRICRRIPPGPITCVLSSVGQIGVMQWEQSADTHDFRGLKYDSSMPEPITRYFPRQRGSLGFGHYPGPPTTLTVIPHWALVLMTAVSPAVWIIRKLRIRRRIRRCVCQSCGYDLRATPDRCPECGAIPGKGKSAS
jgi:hypothetical protein